MIDRLRRRERVVVRGRGVERERRRRMGGGGREREEEEDGGGGRERGVNQIVQL